MKPTEFMAKHRAKLQGVHPGVVGFQFTPEMLAVIDEVNAARLAGKPYKIAALYVAMREEFEIPLQCGQFRRHLLAYVGRSAW